MLIQYIRNGKKQKIGALVATTNHGGYIVIGHGKWNKSLDKYSSTMALQVAKDRADKDSKVGPALSMLTQHRKFVTRAKKYYKDCPLSANTLSAISMAEIKNRLWKDRVEHHSCGEVEEINYKKSNTDDEMSAGC